MLHLVGLGLWSAKDLSVAALEAVRAADEVVAETYTARLMGAKQGELEAVLGRPVRWLVRLDIEGGGDDIVALAAAKDVAFLVVGDPLAATTHTDLVLRAREQGVGVRIHHGASILSAAPGLLGLQHYKFGRTTTVPRPEGSWSPTSPLETIEANLAAGAHTLVLLDIQADEEYMMRADEALRLLLAMAERLATERAVRFTADSPVGVVARAGSPEPLVRTGTAGRLAKLDFGPPLHCLVVPASLHPVEAALWATQGAP